MRAKASYEGRNLCGATVWCVRELIQSHPGRPGRYARIPGEEMLVEMVDAEADDRNMNAFRTLGS